MSEYTTAELVDMLKRCATGKDAGCRTCPMTMTLDPKLNTLFGCVESLQLYAAERLNLLEQKLSKEKNRSPWVCTKHRLPKPYTTVLVDAPWFDHPATGILTTNTKGEIDSWCVESHVYWQDEVTHWMPIPELPEEEER